MALHAPRTPGTDAYVRIYNNDGSEAGACGNGMRCVADVAVRRDRQGHAVTFETEAGLLNCWKADGRRPHGRHGRAALRPGTRSRWPRNSATPARSSCRSGRSTSRSCIRPRSSAWAIRTRSSGSTTSTPTTSRKIGPLLETIRSFPSAPTSRSPGRRARAHRRCAPGSAAPASPRPAARPPARPRSRRRGCARTGRKVTVTLPGGDLDRMARARRPRADDRARSNSSTRAASIPRCSPRRRAR